MNLEECDRCGMLSELIACIHFDTGEVLGNLCQMCIEDYLQHLHAIEIGGEDE
jgi:hypothetical protein